MSDPNFHIATPRLYIHYFLPTNTTHITFLADSHRPLPNDTLPPPPIKDYATTKADVESRIKFQESTGYGRYLVSLRPQTTTTTTNTDTPPFSSIAPNLTPIGVISMKLRPHPKAPKVPDIGFFFIPSQTGKGYATEAARAVLDYFEREKGERDFLGFCDPDNERSKAMFRRLGWVESSGLRNIFGLGDRMDDFTIPCLAWRRVGMGELEEYRA